MGICTKASIVVGWTYAELLDIIEAEGEEDASEVFYDWCNDNDIDAFPPNYDADSDSCIYGIRVSSTSDFSYKELDMDELSVMTKLVKERLAKISEIHPARVYLTPVTY